jgi:hypothetical protein
MSRLNGRIPVEININAPSNRHVPVYDPQYRVWNTIDYQDITSGSAKLSGSNSLNGNQTITGSVLITGSLAVTGSINILGSITGSLFGTASWAQNAISASYAPISAIPGLDTSRIVTGSITASVNVDPNNLFLIKSGSNTYFNIASNSDTTLYSNQFIVKNFTTQEPILTVSQSIVQFATQSSDPSNPAKGGDIWFTSTELYVGLN